MENSQWNWFTPSTTPTDATFSPNVLQTPKTTSDHFQDAFSPFHTQHNVSATPNLAAHYSPETNMLTTDTSAMFFDMTRQSPSFHPTGLDNSDASGSMAPPRHTGAATFQSLQSMVPVHTPPPTRTQSEKRRAPRPYSVMFGTPTPIDQMTTTQVPHLIDQGQMGTLSQSASQPVAANHVDLTAFGMHIPSAHTELYNTQWSLHAPASGIDQSMVNNPNPLLADPFTYQTQNISMDVDPLPNGSPHAFLTNTPQRFDPVHQSSLQPAPIVPSNVLKPLPSLPNHEDMPVPRGAAPDLGLIYQSSGEMLPPARPQSHQQHSPCPNHADSMSPEDIPRRAFPSPAAKLASSHLAINPHDDSQRTPSNGGLKSGLRRSNTTEIRRPHTMYGSIDSLMRSNTTSGIQRKGSPLKRFSRNSTTSLASIAETTPSNSRPRTSIVLTVDSKGRARAETRTMDMSPTKASIRDRYPNLWDDSDSDSDSDETIASTNRHSFVGAPRSEDRNRRAKLDSTLASLEGLHLPRSTSAASNRVTPSKAAIAAAVQLRRQSSIKRHNRRDRTSAPSFADADMLDGESDSESAGGDAGAALRKAIERRDQHREAAAARQSARSRPQSMHSRPAAFPPRTSSLASLAPAGINSAPHMAQVGTVDMLSQQSPLKASPSKRVSGVADAMSSITRCVCNMPFSENQLMLQCTACHLWSHATCVGVPADQLSQPWFCTICMQAAGVVPMSFVHPTQYSQQQSRRHSHVVGWQAAAF